MFGSSELNQLYLLTYPFLLTLPDKDRESQPCKKEKKDKTSYILDLKPYFIQSAGWGLLRGSREAVESMTFHVCFQYLALCRVLAEYLSVFLFMIKACRVTDLGAER